MKREVLEFRKVALKRAILDYILLDQSEQQRLALKPLVTNSTRHIARAPVPWHSSVVHAKRLMETNLFITNPMMMRLVCLFEEFKHLRIVEMNTLSPINFPIGLDDFQAILRNQCITFRQRLFSEWIPKVACLFFENKEDWYSMVENPTSHGSSDLDVGYARLDNFFKSVAALMSNQIWTFVRASLDDFVNFFVQFRTTSNDLSLFSLTLKVQNPQIKFDPSFADIDHVLLSLLKEITETVSQLPRIETKLFSSLAKEELYLPAVNAEDLISLNGSILKNIVSRNAIPPQKHIQIYDKFKGLLTQKTDKYVDDFLRETHQLPEFELVKSLTSLHPLYSILFRSWSSYLRHLMISWQLQRPSCLV